MKPTTRKILRAFLKNRERFELWTGLTLFTVGLTAFLAGWTFLRETPGEWAALPAALLIAMGVLGLSGKVPYGALLINGGLAAYEPKRGGQIAVIYGTALFALGVFGLSSMTYAFLEPSGSYGLAALLGGALILGGLYIIASTPILEPAKPHFEADEIPSIEADEPWYVIDDDATSALPADSPLPPFFPRCLSQRYAVPLVRLDAVAKRPAMLGADDIVAYAMIESDWVETPANYTCVAVEHGGLSPVIEDGDIVGINHAIVDAAWLQGKLVAVYTDEFALRVGFLDHSEGRYWIRPRDETRPALEVQSVQLIGSVEWNLKSAEKDLRPADDIRDEREPASEARDGSAGQYFS